MVWCGILWYGMVRYVMVWYGMVSYGMVWYLMAIALHGWHGIAWHGMAWQGMVWYCIALHCMAWHGMVWYGMVWYGMAKYGMVWYGMVLWKWCGMVYWYRVWYGIMLYGMVWYGTILLSVLSSTFPIRHNFWSCWRSGRVTPQRGRFGGRYSSRHIDEFCAITLEMVHCIWKGTSGGQEIKEGRPPPPPPPPPSTPCILKVWLQNRFSVRTCPPQVSRPAACYLQRNCRKRRRDYLRGNWYTGSNDHVVQRWRESCGSKCQHCWSAVVSNLQWCDSTGSWDILVSGKQCCGKGAVRPLHTAR